MAIASSMKDLAQGITASREDRVKTVKKLQEEARHLTGETRTTMREIRAARKLASGQLRDDLARNEADRKAEVSKIRGDAQGLVKGYQASRKESGSLLHEQLTQETNEMRSELKKVLGDARQTIRNFGTQRRQAGIQLREELSHSQASRKIAVAELTKDAQDMVREFAKSREKDGKTLRKDLARARADSESAVKAIKAEADEMRTGFRNSRADVIGDINEARAAWQELTRGKATKKSAVKATSEAVKIEVAEAVAAEEESPDMEAKLLSAINSHPEGITLVEVAESLGVVPIVLGRVSRKLLNEAKIRKEDKVYFPVTGE
ncbi:MAG: hypothetical protein Q8O55_05080 [Dehalococcoidales bacterium]|nr:hypothetical protein [Dehalococcoidales bacterium]